MNTKTLEPGVFGNRLRNPDARRAVVELLTEYGDMTMNEIIVALDVSRSVVETAIRTAPEVKRVGGIGAGCRGYRYGVVSEQR